jgi:hypothetical protein
MIHQAYRLPNRQLQVHVLAIVLGLLRTRVTEPPPELTPRPPQGLHLIPLHAIHGYKKNRRVWPRQKNSRLWPRQKNRRLWPRQTPRRLSYSGAPTYLGDLIKSRWITKIHPCFHEGLQYDQQILTSKIQAGARFLEFVFSWICFSRAKLFNASQGRFCECPI